MFETEETVPPAKRQVVNTKGPRISLFTFAGLLVIVIASVAAVAFLGQDQIEVLVPTEDVPAFTRINTSNLKGQTIWKQGGDATDALKTSELEGGIALSELPAGEPIDSSDILRPEVPIPARAVILQVTPGNASALDLEVGEQIVLRLTPKRREVESASAVGVLVAIPDDGSTKKQSYAVALGPSEAGRVLKLLGRSRMLITPRPVKAAG